MSIVEVTILAVSSGTLALSEPPRKLPRIVLKITSLLLRSISTYPTMFSHRLIRAEMGLRPPPGGPMAATKVRSMMRRKVRVFLSYHPF